MARQFLLVAWFSVLCSALFAVCFSAAAQAKPSDCSTPRNAADMVFYWQQPGQVDLQKAASCLQPGKRTPGQLETSARRIKALYDMREAFVQMDEISDEPDFVNAEGRAKVVVHPALPAVFLTKQGQRWLWASQSLHVVDQLYEEEALPLERVISKLPDSFRESAFGIEVWQYVGLALLILLALALRLIVKVVVASRIKKLAENFGQEWASNLAEVCAAPMSTLLAALGVRLSYPVLALPIQVGLFISGTVRVVMVVSVVWALYRLVDVFAARFEERAAATETKLDDQLVPLLRKSAKVLVVVAGVLFALQNMNVDVGSLLTGLGIGGLAFALAAKDTLANFFGSIMIFIDRPFQIGDWIVVKGTEGVVEEVGFRSTRIRTFYNSVISVPNSVFTDASIDNYGEREYRRTFVTLNVTYDTSPEQMQAFVEGIRAIIRANEFTRKDYYEVHMSGFGASSLDVMVYFFFKVGSWTDELRERHNVFLEIMRLAQELGVEFAFPTQTLHLDTVAAPGQQRRLPTPPAEGQLADVVQAFAPSGKLARPGGPVIVPGGLVVGSKAAGSEDDG